MTSFTITHYGQCCRRHVVGQQVVSDISVVHSLSVCSLCSESTNTNLILRQLTAVLGTFILRNKHTRLQVPVYTSYNLCRCGCPKIFLFILTPVTPKSRSSPRQLLHPCQVHPQCEFAKKISVDKVQ